MQTTGDNVVARGLLAERVARDMRTDRFCNNKALYAGCEEVHTERAPKIRVKFFSKNSLLPALLPPKFRDKFRHPEHRLALLSTAAAAAPTAPTKTTTTTATAGACAVVLV